MEDQIILYWETDRRFWDRTNYKRGKRLNMHDPKDREMAKIWLQIFAEVRAIRDRATREAKAISGKNRTPYVVAYQSDTGSWSAVPLKRREDLDAAYARGAAAPEMFNYVATYDFTKNQQGPVDDHFASAVPSPPPARVVGRSVSGDTGGSSAAAVAKTLGFFAVFLSAGWFLSKRQERKQLEEEKAAFRRLGMDWSQRARY